MTTAALEQLREFATIEHTGLEKPRLGFLGTGWIGRSRLEAIARSGVAEVAAIADPVREMAAQCARVAPGAALLSSMDDLLDSSLDGVVIATPSALHAEQAIAALERGIPVFCQKPLGRNKLETARVISAARRSNVLLGVDLSYRFVRAVEQVRHTLQGGRIGKVFAADLVFHNAYGPDKAWFYDPKLSGGGCVVDLGIHLVDLALWLLDYPRVQQVSSRLFTQGKPLQNRDTVEDYAVARVDLDSGQTILVSCSWKVHAGCEAIIGGTFYGTRGGVRFHNVNGSFYNFAAEQFRGTSSETIAHPGDEWMGQAAVQWAARLAAGATYDPEIERLIDVAGVLDSIYAG